MDPLDDLLAELRREYSPDEGAKSRVRTAFGPEWERVNASAGLPAIARAKRQRLVLARGLGLAAALGAVGAAAFGVYALAGPSPEEAASLESTPAVHSQAVLPPRPGVEHEASAPVSSPHGTTADDEPPAGATPAEPQSPPAQSPPAQASPAAAAVPDSTPRPTDEVRLLATAAQAWREGRLDAAAQALAEHRRRFPRTSFVEEQRSLTLVVGCAQNLDESLRARARTFLAELPRAPLAESVRKACLP